MSKYIPNYHNVHNKFKLNGFHLNAEDLCRVAYSFIKEGEDFEKPVGDFILDWFDGIYRNENFGFDRKTKNN